MIDLEVKNISKVYKLYQSPVNRLKEIVFRKPFHTPFYALNNINLTVFQGETLGIIGENGAGKSTLLKILAKTLKPTSGNLTVNGRTAALLELGAGFNPELNGEENIYMNAYLMGLTKDEIDAKKNDIINFSELEDFIKRPVKTYSSGMHVRLAFSIATSVNPEILIIDEALSVGDEYFQKKCIDRMMNFKNSGKTIIFCSHNMYHVQELCQKAVWIHKGKIKHIGDTGKVVMDYQNYERDKSAIFKEKISDMHKSTENIPDKPVRIVDMRILDKNELETEFLKTSESAFISFKIYCLNKDTRGHIGFGIIRNDEVVVFGTLTNFDGIDPISFRDGQEFRIRIKSLPLLAGLYSLVVVVTDEFAMHPYDIMRTKNFSVMHGRKEFGLVYVEHDWII